MDAPAGRAQVLVLLHEVDEEADCVGLEVDVAVEGEQETVLRHDGLSLDRDGQLHEAVAEEVVHVHALRPSLLVPDPRLVLEVHVHLGLARQRVDQAAAVGGGHLLGRPDADVGLVDVGGGLVDAADEVLDEPVDL